MNCARENELLDALERGYVGSELTEHVAACESCRELRDVAGALLDDREIAMRDAHVPSAGAMWFRLRLRARQDAEATGRRALVVGQFATVAIALTLVVTFFGSEVRELVRGHTPVVAVVAAMLLALWAATVAQARGGRRRRVTGG